MKIYSSYLMAAAGTIALALAAADVARAQTSSMVTPTPVPYNIQVPDGHTAFLRTQATGTQNYTCMPGPTGYSWRFSGPQATLFITLKLLGREFRQQVTTHYLSPNPAENGMPRPTWQSSLDTSAVWGSAIASSTDPSYVAQGAIPWLLVQVVGRQAGPTGGDALTVTTYIQRINTSGGIAPSLACSETSNAGVTAFVPYTTDYVFFKPKSSY
jgi:hypothetical protein